MNYSTLCLDANATHQIFFSAFAGMVMAIDFIVPTGNPSSFQAADLAFGV
jgi:hypothetical protein